MFILDQAALPAREATASDVRALYAGKGKWQATILGVHVGIPRETQGVAVVEAAKLLRVFNVSVRSGLIVVAS